MQELLTGGAEHLFGIAVTINETPVIEKKHSVVGHSTYILINYTAAVNLVRLNVIARSPDVSRDDVAISSVASILTSEIASPSG